MPRENELKFLSSAIMSHNSALDSILTRLESAELDLLACKAIWLSTTASLATLAAAALLYTHTDWQGRVDEAGTSAAQVYDAALRMIDEAMGETE